MEEFLRLRAELKSAFVAKGRNYDTVLFYPGEDWNVNPDGRIVVDARESTVWVYNEDRGRCDEREFESVAAACDYVRRRYLLRQNFEEMQ